MSSPLGALTWIFWPRRASAGSFMWNVRGEPAMPGPGDPTGMPSAPVAGAAMGGGGARFGGGAFLAAGAAFGAGFLAFKLFCAARQNAVLRRSPFPSP